MARVHSYALVLSAYAYWSLNRAKWIIKYLSPTRILFHVSQTRDLLKIFDFNFSVRKMGSPPIIYYSISCNYNNQLTFSKTRPKAYEKSPYAAQRDQRLCFLTLSGYSKRRRNYHPKKQCLYFLKKTLLIIIIPQGNQCGQHVC